MRGPAEHGAPGLYCATCRRSVNRAASGVTGRPRSAFGSLCGWPGKACQWLSSVEIQEVKFQLTWGKQLLTVSYGLRKSAFSFGRPYPPSSVRAAEVGAATGRRDRPRHAGQPPGGVATSESAEGGGPCG